MEDELETKETGISTPEKTQEVEEKTTEDTFYSKESEGTESESNDEKTEGKEEETPDSTSEEESGEKEEETKEEKESEDKTELKLKLSENSLLENSALEDVESFAKENNLSNEKAQEMLTKQEEAVSNFVEKVNTEDEVRKDEWRKEVINDPIMGGDNLKATSEDARRAVSHFGSEEFADILRETGYGDNPEVVKFLSNIGKLMKDDQLVTGKESGGNVPVENLFYGSN